jgi:hypothetical protein
MFDISPSVDLNSIGNRSLLSRSAIQVSFLSRNTFNNPTCGNVGVPEGHESRIGATELLNFLHLVKHGPRCRGVAVRFLDGL